MWGLRLLGCLRGDKTDLIHFAYGGGNLNIMSTYYYSLLFLLGISWHGIGDALLSGVLASHSLPLPPSSPHNHMVTNPFSLFLSQPYCFSYSIFTFLL